MGNDNRRKCAARRWSHAGCLGEGDSLCKDRRLHLELPHDLPHSEGKAHGIPGGYESVDNKKLDISHIFILEG